MNTPRFDFDSAHLGPGPTPNGPKGDKNRMHPIKISALEDESDIDADELLPVYLESKTKLFQLQSTLSPTKAANSNGKKHAKKSGILISMSDPVSTKLLRKIQRIEDDVLFDRYIAEKQWDTRRVQLEKDAAAAAIARRSEFETTSTTSQESDTLHDVIDEVSKEAADIGAALLQDENESDDDAHLANLFASLPVNEVDPITGKSSTVATGSDGVKVTRDFGKWTGVSPTRVLEEACRARLVPHTQASQSQFC